MLYRRMLRPEMVAHLFRGQSGCLQLMGHYAGALRCGIMLGCRQTLFSQRGDREQGAAGTRGNSGLPTPATCADGAAMAPRQMQPALPPILLRSANCSCGTRSIAARARRRCACCMGGTAATRVTNAAASHGPWTAQQPADLLALLHFLRRSSLPLTLTRCG